jgi:hypothetical protein
MMTEKEAKFHRDVSELVIRAFRAGSTIGSIKMVFNLVLADLERSEPYIKAALERDLAP